MMEPDGSTKIIFNVPDFEAAFKRTERVLKDLDEAMRSLAAAQSVDLTHVEEVVKKMSELGQVPELDIAALTAPPKNWRPWHKHTLPNRKRRK